jgi:UDP:flavonoid glycosyltransferase YjiC (YdhE family)
MDQHLNMAGLVRLGAGILIRTDLATTATLRASASRILDYPDYTTAARRVAGYFSAYNAADRFRKMIDDLSTRPRLTGIPVQDPAEDVV